MADTSKTAKRRRISVKWILIFFLGYLILDFLFWPSILDKWIGPFFSQGNGSGSYEATKWIISPSGVNTGEVYLNLFNMETSFINWRWATFSTWAHMLLTLGWHIFWIGLLIYFYSSIHTGSMITGTEHGSARKLTDEEFDDLLPHYNFRPDEYKYPREDEHRELDILESSNVDVFKTFNFKNNNLEDAKNDK